MIGIEEIFTKVKTIAQTTFGMSDNELCLRLALVDYDGALALEELLMVEENGMNINEFVRSVASHVVATCEKMKTFTESLE